MDTNVRTYPVGVQSFQKIREENYLYIDKTQYICQMLETKSTYLFLSRPRRFGKSLFVSTLQCYFEGRSELFDGLALGEYEKEWTKYPVLHFDFSGATYKTTEGLLKTIDDKLTYYEDIYGTRPTETMPSLRFGGIIRRAFEKTGHQVVVLIDEYDYPILEKLNEPDMLSEFRDIMQDFYAPLKPLGDYLRFVFLTGINKFSQMSIFSKLNNINNISMLDQYSGICGITEEELQTQLYSDVELLAKSRKMSIDDMFRQLKNNYDGYHFSEYSPDIYNPFSLFMSVNNCKLGSYWFESGTPSYLIAMLDKFNVQPSEIGGQWVAVDQFNAPIENMISLIPLLYHSGYITIKKYDSDIDFFFLDIPNKEVRDGLMKMLLPHYVSDFNVARKMIADAALAFRCNDIDAALNHLKNYFLKVPYTNDIKYEGHYQQMLYVMFDLMGGHPVIETHTSGGRIDLTLRSKTTIYIIELKINDSAQSALDQINSNNYAAFYAAEGLDIVKIGIHFDTSTRTIEEWIVER